MKFLNKALSITIGLLLLNTIVYAQLSTNWNTQRSNRSVQATETVSPFNLNLQLGVSTPFGFPSGSSSIIPDIGVDFNFGDFGIRATGQFFKTALDFDLDNYLDPILSNVTQTGDDQHSNIQIGISPYINFPQKAFTIQAALGLKYLMQNGADLKVNYGGLPPGAMFDASTGELKRNTFVIEPSIRAVIGNPNKALKFFIEAGYAIPMSKEYTYTNRNLAGVVLPDGSIDPDLMEFAPTVNHTEKLIPASPWIGIGLELNLTSPRKEGVHPKSSKKPIKTSKRKSKNRAVDCCDGFKAYTAFSDGICCNSIYYDVSDSCTFNRAIINALYGEKISVIQDQHHSQIVDNISQHIMSGNLETGINKMLGEFCAYPTTAGDVDIEIIFYSTDNTVCKDTITLICPQAPEPECKCDDWEENQQITISSGSNQVATGLCNSLIVLNNPGLLQISVPNYICYPDTCTTTYTWELFTQDGTGTLIDNGSGNSFDVTFPSYAGYKVIVTPYCGGKKCLPCVFKVIIEEEEICECGQWTEDGKVVIDAGGSQTTVSCDNTTTLNSIGTFTLTAPTYFCNPNTPDCQATYSWSILQVGTSNIWVGSGQTVNVPFLSTGTYEAMITPFCGTTPCPPCEFTIVIKEEDDCDCGEWNGKPTSISDDNNNVITTADCGSINVLTNPGSYWLTAPNFICSPNNDNCQATYDWVIHKSGTSLIYTNSGQQINVNFATIGTYYVTINPTCGTINCPPCSFTIVIKEENDCECGEWNNEEAILINSPDNQSHEVYCNGAVQFGNTGNYQFSLPNNFFCTPSNCQLDYNWVIQKIGAPLGLGVVKSGNTINVNFLTSGTYLITITPYCGSNPCPPCVFKVIIEEENQYSDCCEDLNIIIGGEDPCCPYIYYLSPKDSCRFTSVDILSLNNTPFMVDKLPYSSSSLIGPYTSYTLSPSFGPYFPPAPTQQADLVGLCITSGQMANIKLIFHFEDGGICEKTFTIYCPILDECSCERSTIKLEGTIIQAGLINAQLGDTKHFTIDGYCMPWGSLDSCDTRYRWTVRKPDNFLMLTPSTSSLDIGFDQVGEYTITACIICNDKECCNTIKVIVKEASTCNCDIKTITLNGNNVPFDTTYNYTNGLSPANGIELSIIGECLPPKKCNTGYYWEIIKNNGTPTIVQGRTITTHYSFNNTYKYIAHIDCYDGNSKTPVSSCEEEFTINAIKSSSTEIFSPIDDPCECGNWHGSTNVVFSDQNNNITESDLSALITLGSIGSYQITLPDYVCSNPNCSLTYKWLLYWGGSYGAHQGVQQTINSNQFNFTFTHKNTYALSVIAYCNNIHCARKDYWVVFD